MEIRYSCLCGARNCIPAVKRPPGGKPAFFYCQDCGKPSLDHCLRCGFNAPPGSGHRFCSGCGAGADSIMRGVETLDFRREATDVVLGLLCAPGVYYVL